jgi:D-3-phosphoglycerate dehydrogenase / 2-oxoglutarate reductase
VNKLVLAIGHTFDLKRETEILAEAGIDLLDARGLRPNDSLWARAEGILLGTAAKMDAAMFARCPALRGVVRYGIGYDNVDVDAARAARVRVGIVRNYCVDEVAEHALAGALATLRSLHHWDRTLRAGQWRGRAWPRHRRIATLRLGIMGYGLIGRALARKAAGLFGEIVVHDPWVDAPESTVDGYGSEPNREAFLGRIDVLSMHMPLTPETRHVLDAAALALLPKDAVVINASRGGLIDEAALDAALRSGHLGGAAIDTFDAEPVPLNHVLLDNPKVLLSPHVAWLSEQAEAELRDLAARDVVRILNGQEPAMAVV